MALLLAGCGVSPPPFERIARATDHEVALAVAPGSPTHYDAATGVLWLPMLRAQGGGIDGCYDVTLSTVSTEPVRVQLESAVPRSCDPSRLQPSEYDAASGTLRLPGLAVRGTGGTDCYDAALHTVGGTPMQLELSAAAGAPCAAAATPLTASDAFSGSLVLGAPSGRSVRLKVYSATQSGQAWVAYGLAPGIYNHRSEAFAVTAGRPLEVALDDLLPNLRYHYRLQFQAAAGGASGPGEEYAFRTARPPGATFTFTVQADSHLDENADLPTYQRTLDNVRADDPDFHVDLGDTFMTEKHAEPLRATSPQAASEAEVDRRYAYEHGNFGRIGHSVPLFLVNGNHDGELGWLKGAGANSLPTWVTQARKRFFANPVPDGFYRGDTLQELFVGERAAWYAWEWGDALFIVLDPFWNSARPGAGDAWGLTLGERQYRWLADTLARSGARWKFVFVHNLVGGLDGAMRGGIEAAPYYEWGGRNGDGADGFAQRRPGWERPIHPLLVRHGVSAVFKGHDHVYVRQELDGVVYQTVPQPSARNFSSGANIARDYHYVAGTIASSSGHLRVTVSPQGVKADYVRAWLPSQETAARRNGQVDASWTLALPHGAGG